MKVLPPQLTAGSYRSQQDSLFVFSLQRTHLAGSMALVGCLPGIGHGVYYGQMQELQCKVSPEKGWGHCLLLPVVLNSGERQVLDLGSNIPSLRQWYTYVTYSLGPCPHH